MLLSKLLLLFTLLPCLSTSMPTFGMVSNLTHILAYPYPYRPPSGFSPDAPFMFIPARASFFTRLLPTVNSTARSMLPHTKNQSPAAAASAMLCRAVGVSSQPPTTATASGLHSLEDLAFNNTFTAELPGDPSRENKIRQVHGALYSFVNPTPTGTEPTTIAYSKDVAAMIGLDPADCERPEFAMIFSGNAPLPGSEPYAQCYGGHQFGSWAGQLGDGRAISLGEVNAPGQDNVRWELQLKVGLYSLYTTFVYIISLFAF